MLSKAHLTSHSRMSGSRWVITPSWLSGWWRSFLYSSSEYSCHLFLISSASVKNLKGGVQLPIVLKPIDKEARLVERDVCFISEASNQREGSSCPKADFSHWQSGGGGRFYRWRKGLHTEAHSQLWESSRNWSCGGLIGCSCGCHDQYLISQASFLISFNSFC